ncbi:MAG: ADP-ribosylglycohydrolase family protein, partial [Candidatus Woesearchaeota archaeon]
MPNGGIDNCANCIYFQQEKDQKYCSIREVRIANPYWTYCANNKGGTFNENISKNTIEKPNGPIFASGLYESSYIRIPWYKKCEPKVYSSCSCIVCGKLTKEEGIIINDQGIAKGFCSNEHYLKWWKENQDSQISNNYYQSQKEAVKKVDLHKIYTELYRKEHLAIDFIHMGIDKELEFKSKEINIEDKIKGVFLGLAVGDSIGNLATFKRRNLKWIINYFQEKKKLFVSDDTKLTIILAKSLLENKGLNPDDLASKIAHLPNNGMGIATNKFIRNYKKEKKEWFEASINSAGNGAAMRAIPIGILYRNDFEKLKLTAGLQALVTHKSSMAIASSIIVAYAIALLIGMNNRNCLQNNQQKIEFSKKLAEVIQDIESDQKYKTRNTNKRSSLYQ